MKMGLQTKGQKRKLTQLKSSFKRNEKFGKPKKIKTEINKPTLEDHSESESDSEAESGGIKYRTVDYAQRDSLDFSNSDDSDSSNSGNTFLNLGQKVCNKKKRTAKQMYSKDVDDNEKHVGRKIVKQSVPGKASKSIEQSSSDGDSSSDSDTDKRDVNSKYGIGKGGTNEKKNVHNDEEDDDYDEDDDDDEFDSDSEGKERFKTQSSIGKKRNVDKLKLETSKLNSMTTDQLRQSDDTDSDSDSDDDENDTLSKSEDEEEEDNGDSDRAKDHSKLKQAAGSKTVLNIANLGPKKQKPQHVHEDSLLDDDSSSDSMSDNDGSSSGKEDGKADIGSAGVRNIKNVTAIKEGGLEEKDNEPEDELVALKKELADVPLEDLVKIKEKLGLKVFNQIMHGGKYEEKKQKVFKRANKNRPVEMSSKKKVPMLRQSVVPKEQVRRDPRFDDLSGVFEDKHFSKNYSFLDDVKTKEKLLIQKKMEKTKDDNKKRELKKLLNRMNQQEQAEQRKRRKMELEQQWKEKEKALVKDGKAPYFLKKSEKKKLELADKFRELQKSGKVDHYMGKKMKKNAQKEKKKLPNRHQRFM